MIFIEPCRPSRWVFEQPSFALSTIRRNFRLVWFPCRSLRSGILTGSLRLRIHDAALLFLQFQSGLVLFHELAELVSRVQQAVPLLVIQGHGETSEAIHAHPTLFSHAKFQASGAARALLFQ